MTNSNLKKKKAENLKEVSKKQQRNSFNLVKRKQVNEAKKVVCRWELLNILISSRVFRFFLKIPNLDQYAIGIGKIAILASVLNSYDTHKMTPNREYLTESDI